MIRQMVWMQSKQSLGSWVHRNSPSSSYSFYDVIREHVITHVLLPAIGPQTSFDNGHMIMMPTLELHPPHAATTSDARYS